jgi:hypothetical protein
VFRRRIFCEPRFEDGSKILNRRATGFDFKDTLVITRAKLENGGLYLAIHRYFFADRFHPVRVKTEIREPVGFVPELGEWEFLG